MMIREYGSTFWIEPELDCSKRHELSTEDFHIAGNDQVFLSNGRSCIRLAIESAMKRGTLSNKIAVVPAFTCYTCAEPFEELGFKIIPLPISTDLTTSAKELKKTVEDNNATIVLLHQYFGFETMKDVKDVIQEMRNRGVVFIEDRTQSLYSMTKPLPVDYHVASMRKWAGLPDGGFAVCEEGSFDVNPKAPNLEFEKVKLEASYLKYQYIVQGTGEKALFRNLYEKAEELLDAESGYYQISTSSTCVQSSIDVVKLRNQRRENYEQLYSYLMKQQCFEPIFRLSDKDVPLYFPIRTKGFRNELQQYLASKDIYAPIIWPKEVSYDVGNEAEYLYQDLLCIPIDQRYGKEDVNRVGDAIVRFAESIND